MDSFPSFLQQKVEQLFIDLQILKPWLAPCDPERTPNSAPLLTPYSWPSAVQCFSRPCISLDDLMKTQQGANTRWVIVWWLRQEQISLNETKQYCAVTTGNRKWESPWEPKGSLEAAHLPMTKKFPHVAIEWNQWLSSELRQHCKICCLLWSHK